MHTCSRAVYGWTLTVGRERETAIAEYRRETDDGWAHDGQVMTEKATGTRIRRQGDRQDGQMGQIDVRDGGAEMG